MSAPSPSIIQPDWARRPTGEEIGRYYPKAAVRENLEGEAVLQCKVTVAGSLADCTAYAETPSGVGFGEAVLKMASIFRMLPMTPDGKPSTGESSAFLSVSASRGQGYGYRWLGSRIRASTDASSWTVESRQSCASTTVRSIDPPLAPT
ncbi:TonB family protein [Phenylobacterium sp.]|uniref:TonB family protein n=1 Tax=Phenylobacterium sp. TaxID=1871053 RepID=UPI0039C9A805